MIFDCVLVQLPPQHQESGFFPSHSTFSNLQQLQQELVAFVAFKNNYVKDKVVIITFVKLRSLMDVSVYETDLNWVLMTLHFS